MSTSVANVPGVPRPGGPATADGRSWRTIAIEHIDLVCVAIFALVYIATRLAVLWRFPPYFDETFYAHEAPIALHQPGQRFISLIDDKGPLLIWLSFIPQKLGFAPLTSVRLVAQAAGLWTMVMVGLTTRLIAGRAAAAVAMGLSVVTPLWLVFTAIGFDEPLVAAAATSALYLQLRLADRPNLRDATLLGLALGAGLLTKESGKLAVILLPVSLLLVSWERPWIKRLATWVGCAALALVIGYALYSVERLSPLYYELGEIRRSLGQYTPVSTALSHIGSIYQQNWPGYRVELDHYLTPTLILAFAVGAGVLLARRTRMALVLLAWTVIPLASVVFIASRPLGHYLVPAVTPAFPVMAVGLLETYGFLSRRSGRTRWPAVVVAVVAVVPSLWFDVQFIAKPATTKLPAYDDRELITDAAAGGGWKQISEVIRQRTVGAHGPVTIAYSGIITFAVSLLLGDPEQIRYPYVSIASPAATAASFVTATGALPPACTATPPPNDIAFPPCSMIPPSRLRRLTSYQRPRGGVVVTLYAVSPP